MRQVQLSQRLGGRDALGALAQVGGLTAQLREVVGGVVAAGAGIGGCDARGQVQAVEDHQAAEGDHQVEGQHQHAAEVVRVQPGALGVLAGAQGEEVLEDAPVRDDARQQRNEHQQRGHAHHPASLQHPAAVLGGAQFEVKAVEKVAAHGLARGEHFARLRVQAQGLRALLFATGAPLQRERGVAFVGQVQAPLRGLRCGALRGLQGLGRGRLARAVASLQFGAHPQADFLAVEAQAAGQEDGKHQPAQHQPRPGVQPGHGLAQTFALGGGGGAGHGAAPGLRSARARAPRASAGSRVPAQAVQALRA